MNDAFYQLLPGINASLNGISFILLISAFVAIRKGNQTRHIKLMSAALLVSTLFMICYLLFHFKIGFSPFKGTGFVRTVYFGFLIPHIILAAAIVPLVLITLTLAIKKKDSAHRKWAKVSLPLWIIVSITGVLIYLMNYHLVV